VIIYNFNNINKIKINRLRFDFCTKWNKLYSNKLLNFRKTYTPENILRKSKRDKRVSDERAQ
jgi:hypothetical protein